MKPHVPFRGDNTEVGKKTGVSVRRVEPTSDGFEPFEDLMVQVDRHARKTPPPMRRKKKSMPRVDDEYDEDGEVSMDVDSAYKCTLPLFI